LIFQDITGQNSVHTLLLYCYTSFVVTVLHIVTLFMQDRLSLATRKHRIWFFYSSITRNIC